MANIDCKDLIEDATPTANLFDLIKRFSSKEYYEKERKRVAVSYALLNKQIEENRKRGIKTVVVRMI